MPTHTYFIRSENYKYLLKVSENNDCSMSEYLNRLIADDWGSENKGGTSEIKEVAPEKKRPPVPNIEGVTLGIPVRSDRRRCRVCGFNLDSQNRCSQKKCKLFLKVQ